MTIAGSLVAVASLFCAVFLHQRPAAPVVPEPQAQALVCSCSPCRTPEATVCAPCQACEPCPVVEVCSCPSETDYVTPSWTGGFGVGAGVLATWAALRRRDLPAIAPPAQLALEPPGGALSFAWPSAWRSEPWQPPQPVSRALCHLAVNADDLFL